MQFDILSRYDNLTELHLSGRLTNSALLEDLTAFSEERSAAGKTAALVDLSGITAASASGLAALVEWIRTLRGFDVALLRPSKPLRQAIEKCHAGDLLPLHETPESALKSAPIKAGTLAGTRAVALCAGRGSRMGRLSEQWPKPMLDICGRPMLDHTIRHLASFGIKQCYVNPGHLGAQIPKHFNENPIPGQTLVYANEVNPDGTAQAIGSASTLVSLAQNHSAFDSDFIVLCGDALTDVNLAEMMQFHRKSGADITIAALRVPPHKVEKYGIIEAATGGRITSFQEKPTQAEANSTLANSGIYILNPRVLADIPRAPMQDIGHDLLPHALAKGRRLYAYEKPFAWLDVGCGADYVTALSAVLEGTAPVSPMGKQTRPGLWVAPDAKVGRLARISGPCFIGPNVRIHSGARIIGPTVIGAGSVIERGAMVKNSLILPDTYVGKGAMVDRVIAGPDWACDHRFALGADTVTARLDYVTPIVLPTELERTA
ncbi:NDP-sugar synthase [Alphaproteobacteria bacterium KMM 3653]|uniref:NDP-sugar synthase n=1 Tax=Harenicola maris TaxID=2841044 RepID=A0AAP2CSY0_9RHOB|nr:NDP-sugar synthase [Harenicola maris]